METLCIHVWGSLCPVAMQIAPRSDQDSSTFQQQMLVLVGRTFLRGYLLVPKETLLPFAGMLVVMGSLALVLCYSPWQVWPPPPPSPLFPTWHTELFKTDLRSYVQILPATSQSLLESISGSHCNLETLQMSPTSSPTFPWITACLVPTGLLAAHWTGLARFCLWPLCLVLNSPAGAFILFKPLLLCPFPWHLPLKFNSLYPSKVKSCRSVPLSFFSFLQALPVNIYLLIYVLTASLPY